MDQVVHIDGDILVYAGGFAAERGEYKMTYMADGYGREATEFFAHRKELDARWDELKNPPMMIEFQRHPEPVEYALSNVRNIIDAICKELSCDRYVVYLSGPTNFRNELATIRPYKGNRDKAHKPVHGPAIREYLSRRHPCVLSDNEEADDVIGYTHYSRWRQDPESSCIATQDKDLNMIPGWHYNFAKQTREFISPELADYNFYHQLLTGDPTDNIQGVPGCGKVRASKLLTDCVGVVHMYEVCKEAYGNDAALLENARLLWIRREPGQLWEPPLEEKKNVAE